MQFEAMELVDAYDYWREKRRFCLDIRFQKDQKIFIFYSIKLVCYGGIWLIKLAIKFCIFVFKTLKIVNGSNSLFRGCDILIINIARV